MSPEPTRLFTIPLFPLHAVLFPYFPIQLHVFEPRYRVMINACIEQQSSFGITLIREGSEVGEPAIPYEIGCAARIVAVKRLPDSRLDIVAVGVRRFKLLDWMITDESYLVGHAEEYDDVALPDDGDPDHSDVERISRDLGERLRRYLADVSIRAGVGLPELDLPDDSERLAYCVGSIAQVNPIDKQRLLEMTNPVMRLNVASEMLDLLIKEFVAPEPAQSRRDANEAEVRPLDLTDKAWVDYLKMGAN